jgi:hypothetical protein
MNRLNPELATIERDVIAEMRQEGWEEDDIMTQAQAQAIVNSVRADVAYILSQCALLEQLLQAIKPE